MQNSDINVSELIKTIEADEFEHIDFFVLSNLVKIVHQLGLKKGEVLTHPNPQNLTSRWSVLSPIRLFFIC